MLELWLRFTSYVTQEDIQCSVSGAEQAFGLQTRHTCILLVLHMSCNTHVTIVRPSSDYSVCVPIYITHIHVHIDFTMPVCKLTTGIAWRTSSKIMQCYPLNHQPLYAYNMQHNRGSLWMQKAGTCIYM